MTAEGKGKTNRKGKFERHIMASGPVSKVIAIPMLFVRETGLEEGDLVDVVWPPGAKFLRIELPPKPRGGAKNGDIKQP